MNYEHPHALPSSARRNQAFLVNISSVAGAILADGAALATLVNDD